MSIESNSPLQGQVIGDTQEFSTHETQQICSITFERLVGLVSEGVVEPKNPKSSQWVFDGVTVLRAIKAVRLQRELEIDWSAMALVLDLLEQIDTLECQLAARAPQNQR